jgi:transcriptional regulator NrdR family protein
MVPTSFWSCWYRLGDVAVRGSDQCPKCGSDSDVLNSRRSTDNPLRRRRQCVSCGLRWSTFEVRVVSRKTDATIKRLGPVTGARKTRRGLITRLREQGPISGASTDEKRSPQ